MRARRQRWERKREAENQNSVQKVLAEGGDDAVDLGLILEHALLLVLHEVESIEDGDEARIFGLQ